MLTLLRLQELLEYNSETGVFNWKTARGGISVGDEAGQCGSDGYIKIRIDGKLYRAHRLAWLITFGSWPEGNLDHEDRVRNNNRISNLRIATVSQNGFNVGLIVTNTSGFKGVGLHKQSGLWRARIVIRGKEISLGYRHTREEAAALREKAEFEYRQEFKVKAA